MVSPFPPPSRARATLDLAGLLTIDVASELRKLSQAQLAGPWQLPAELIRRALRAGAQRLDVVLSRQRVRLSHDGQVVPEAALRCVAALLDPGTPPATKHDALTRLEAASDFALLALVGLAPKRLAITSESAGTRWVLKIERGAPPSLACTAGRGQDGTSFDMTAPALERRKIQKHLESVCRFVPALLRINGRRIENAREHTLVREQLQAPLRGEVRIPCEGETAQAWLLEHGVVTTSLTIADAPAFEATVELGDDSHDHSPARVRERIQPLLSNLREQSVELVVRAASQGDAYPEPLRARLSRLVLSSLRHGFTHPSLVRVPIFRAIIDGHSTCTSLETLRERAEDAGPHPVLLALHPRQRPERHALGAGLVLIAEESERSPLADLLHVRFRPPDPQYAAHGPLAISRRLLAMRHLVRRTASFIRHPRRHPPLRDDQLTTSELRFLAELRACSIEDAARLRDIRLSEGAGPVRRSRDRLLLLPRHNPLVRAAIIACSRDLDWWLYPALMALLDGRESPPPSVRRSWLERALGPGSS